VIVRRYQTASRKSRSPIPEAAVSGAKGTVMVRSSSRSIRPRSRPVSPRDVGRLGERGVERGGEGVRPGEEIGQLLGQGGGGGHEDSWDRR